MIDVCSNSTKAFYSSHVRKETKDASEKQRQDQNSIII